MAYRDRTALFLRYRTESRALHGSRSSGTPFPSEHSSDARVLTAGDASLSVDASAVVDLHAALVSDVSGARTLLAELREGYATHLLPRFGDSDGDAGGVLETKVRETAHRLTARLHAADGRLRALAARSGGKKGGEDADGKVRRNLQARFARDLQAISSSFRARQKEYLESLRRQRDALASPHAARSSTPDGLDAFDADGALDQALIGRQADSRMRERERELHAVSASIGDLAVLVKDLAGMVVDQGTLLDRIDYNLEDVEESTAKAVGELRTAQRTQARGQGVVCIVALAVLCGVLMILLLLKWTS